jgi:hypothetical protein
VDRRRFLQGLGAITASGIGAAIAAACGQTTATRPSVRRSTTTTPPAVREADGLPIASWLVEENARPGTTTWVIERGPVTVGIEGYTDKVSAVAGEELGVHVHSTSSVFRADVYRMGYYGGAGARLVESIDATGSAQSAPRLLAGTNTVECDWSRSFALEIDDRYLQGAYLIKLLGSNGSVRYVPFLIRDDASRAAFVIQSSVTTWQAYNLWHGYSLYGTTMQPGSDDYDNRSRIVSYDRPYGSPPLDAHGSGDFLGNEYPLVYLAEKLGLDATYWTDVDLHAQPSLLNNHKALISLGHDEYWSWEMRYGVLDSLDRGVNFAVLGANCCYRQVRFEASPLGTNRRMICYKDAAEDPITSVRPELATAVSWASPPVNRPESELIGSMYQSYGASDPLVVTHAEHWAYAGSGLRNGSKIPKVIGSEFDAYESGLSAPDNVEILAHSPTHSVSGPLHSDMTYYTKDRAGGVFATGTADWVTSLWDGEGALPRLLSFGPVKARVPLAAITLNVLRVFGAGPAGVTHPSVANWRSFYAPGGPVNLGVDV